MGAYDELLKALESYNEQGRPDLGESMVHHAVKNIMRPRKSSLRRPDDFEDVCQEVEIAIAVLMREQRRKVLDVVRQVPTIVSRAIIDMNRRSKISQRTQVIDDERWDAIERAGQRVDEGMSDAEVRLLLDDLVELTDRDRVVLQALCDGYDNEGIRAALERLTGEPVTENAAKQALFRARTRLRDLQRGGKI